MAGLENDRELARAEPSRWWSRCQGLWALRLDHSAEGSPGTLGSRWYTKKEAAGGVGESGPKGGGSSDTSLILIQVRADSAIPPGPRGNGGGSNSRVLKMRSPFYR